MATFMLREIKRVKILWKKKMRENSLKFYNIVTRLNQNRVKSRNLTYAQINFFDQSAYKEYILNDVY